MSIHRPSPQHALLVALALAALLAAGPALSADTPPSETEAALRAAERRAQQAELLAEQKARSGAQAEALRRAAEEQRRAREALSESQRELAEAAARVAEMSARIAGEDMRRALRDGALGRPLYGLVLEQDSARGVAVSAVSPLGPAQEAGVVAQDRLLAVGGRPLDAGSAEERLAMATALLREAAYDPPVKLLVERQGSQLEVSVTPRSLPQLSGLGSAELDAARWAEEMARVATPMTRFRIGELSPFARCADGEDCLAEALLASQRWNGLRLFPLNPELGRYFDSDRGVLVLESGSDHPLRPGDVLLSVAGKAVDTPAEAMRQLRGGSQDSRELLLRRNGRELRLSVDAVDLDFTPLRGLLPVPPAPPAPPPRASDAPVPAAEAGVSSHGAGVLGRVLAH